MNLLDAHDLMAAPLVPMEWVVDQLIPAGTVMDLFSPPGVGKTTLLTDLALTIAGEDGDGKWHGRACWAGPVVVLGGERTNRDALARDLHRSGRHQPPKGALTFPVDGDGDCPPIWGWDRKVADGAGGWRLTAWGAKVTDHLLSTRPVLVILDTILSSANGCDLLDQPQQYALGQTIRRWGRQIGAGATITASHTNQASASGALTERLDYLSRAGGNGYPGALRHIAGMTKLRPGEVPGFDPRDDETLFAIGFSKFNESPRPRWTNYKPAIFGQRNGQLALVADSDEVADRLVLADDDKPERPRGGKRAAGPVNKYKAAKDGEWNGRAYGSC